jgi:hypothetical protein
MIKSIRKYAAVDIEMPAPVPIARYIARQAGHFGTSTRPAAGIIHPAAARHGAAHVSEGASVSRFDSVDSAVQHP